MTRREAAGLPHDPVRVVLGDADGFARRALKEALQDAGLVVIGVSGAASDAADLAAFYRPEVLLLDATLPDSLAAVRHLHVMAPEVVCVLLAPSVDDDVAIAGLRAGAQGFLSKATPVEGLARASGRWSTARPPSAAT
ncbi:MAG TPA: response regulator [Baekduia sp.]|nr:response regulator [Baekduia sp.]